MGTISLFLVTITTITLVENLAYCHVMTVIANGKETPLLRDKNENTCVTVQDSNILVKVSEGFTFTWMAVLTNGIGSYVPQNPFKITFKSETGHVLRCTNGVQKFNQDTIDIYCKMKVKVKEVVAFLSGPLFICELEIGGACHRGWFGDRCQYRCRCSKGECAPNGTCLAGDRCDTQWFGPTCQYVNLVHNEGGSVHADPVLLDQDDSTCMRVLPRERFYVKKTEPFVFTWMMLVTKGIPSQTARPFSVTAISDETRNRLLNCNNERQHIYGTTVHIYCDFIAEKVKEVEVNPNLSFFLCSWYISGGRNVALRQQLTSQSSAYSSMYSKNAVDGDVATMCTGTKHAATKHTWRLSFVQPIMIHRIRIYSYRSLTGRYIGNYDFRISTYDRRGSQVHLFKDPRLKPRPRYFTFRFRPKSLSSIAVWLNGINQYSSVLFCELQAWGDCSEGYYGLDCIKECPKLCPKSCNIIDGQCSSAICSSDASGVACLRTCPVDCIDDCDPETGQCPEASSTGTPLIVFLTITTLGILSASSVVGFKLVKIKEPRT